MQQFCSHTIYEWRKCMGIICAFDAANERTCAEQMDNSRGEVVRRVWGICMKHVQLSAIECFVRSY